MAGVLKSFRGDRLIQSSETSIRLRLICFIISFVLHGILVYWMATTKYTIDTDPFGFEVKEVVITPMEGIFYPGISDEPASSGIPEESASRGGVSIGEPPLMAAPSGSQPGLRMDDQGRFPEPARDFSSGFKLELPRDYMSKLPQDFELAPKREDMIPQFDYSPLQILRNRARSGPSVGSVFPLTSGDLSKNVRVRRTRSTHSGKAVSPSVRQFDIEPWAASVVAKIQRNWELSSPDASGIEEPVRIAVTIERSGNVRSVEVISPSDEEALDRSAINAIRMSFPLPQLPSDFPEDELEIVLVFKIDG